MLPRIVVFAVFLLVVSHFAVVSGQPTLDLLNEINQAKGALDASRLPDLAVREAELLRAIEHVDRSFAEQTSTENYQAWLSFLDLDPLIDAIHDEASVSVRGRAAVEVARRLRGPEEGLELSYLRQLRDAVDHYIAALKYSDPKRGLAAAGKALDTLADLIAPVMESEATKTDSKSSSDADQEASEFRSRQLRQFSDLSPEETAQVESLLLNLADTGQASQVIARFRSHYSGDNVRMIVDGRQVTDAITRPVDNPNAVNDCILGTRVIGRARVRGAVTAQLLPSVGHVRLLLRLDGQFSTNSRGYNGPVSLDTSGHGVVYAARQLAITERGIVLGEPIATASLSTRIDRIHHPLRLVRRIAAKKAAESKSQAEAISRGKLRQRVLDDFAQQTAENSNRSFPDVDAKLSPWLQRLNLPSVQRQLVSTSDSVVVNVNWQREHGLAAGQPAPDLHSVRMASGQGYVAAVQVHESVLSTALNDLLAGGTFTPEKLDDLTSAFGLQRDEPTAEAPIQSEVMETRSLAQGLEDPDASEGDVDEDESFEVDFSNFRPVYMEARDQSLRLGIRGTRFSQGERELKRPLEVAAVYRPVRQMDGTMILIRDEEIDLNFPGSRRLTLAQTAIKANIEEGFGKLFPLQLLYRPLEVPDSVDMPALQGKSYHVNHIDLQAGWVTVTIR